MRIALLTEGVSEYTSLPSLISELQTRSGNVILRPTKVHVQPDASARVIAKACKPSLLLAGARADMVLLVLDREQQNHHPGVLAAAIEEAIRDVCGTKVRVRVIVKDRAYENWLVSDLEALALQPRRFKVTNAIRARVEPNRADSMDAIAILKSAAIGTSYDKVKDSQRITMKMSVSRAAQNSRSFRHFLHVLGDSDYQTQCRNPA